MKVARCWILAPSHGSVIDWATNQIVIVGCKDSKCETTRGNLSNQASWILNADSRVVRVTWIWDDDPWTSQSLTIVWDCVISELKEVVKRHKMIPFDNVRVNLMDTDVVK